VPKPWFQLSPAGELALKGVPVPSPYKLNVDSQEKSKTPGRFSGIRKLVNNLGPEFKDIVQKLTRYQPLPDYKSKNSYGWKLMQAILGEWISESKVPVIIVVIPVFQYVEKTADYKNIRNRFDEFSKANGANVHHVIDDLWTYSEKIRRTFRFRTDCHLTPLAHKVIGESIAKIITPLLRREK
jgi:hypothetical protein